MATPNSQHPNASSPYLLNPDFLIIGAGIVGLALARELKHRYPDQQVTILEKEPAPGRHASGRNSGVLHSGIYYPPGTLKARVCAQGATELAAYCQERLLPFTRPGKLLVPVQAADAPQLDLLAARAQEHGIPVTRIHQADLQRLEPDVRTAPPPPRQRASPACSAANTSPAATASAAWPGRRPPA